MKINLERAAMQQEPVADFSGELESAFWEFDARRKGYGKWKHRPQSERDAFKCAVANIAAPQPVKEVELSDEELWAAAKTAKSNDLIDAFRAVIAKHKEKNNR